MATFFTTAGRLDAASNGRAADDETTQVRNRWTAPDTPGPATVWVVARDDRGAVSWRELAIDVVP